MNVLAKEKDIIKAYGKNVIFAVGYCKLQYLLRYSTAYYKTAGIAGWYSNNYVFECGGFFGLEIVISTGYCPVGKQYLETADYEPYETAAAGICGKYDQVVAEQKVNELRNKFLQNLLKKYFNLLWDYERNKIIRGEKEIQEYYQSHKADTLS